MSEFIRVFNVVAFVFMIIAAVLCGVSIGLNVIISRMLKKLINLTDDNFKSVTDVKKREDVLKIIEDSKRKAINNANEVKELNKVKKKNKWRKIFKMKEIEEPSVLLDKKHIYLDMANGISEVFYSGEKVDNSFLLFTEKELFEVIITILRRADGIIKGAKITWLDKMSVAFIVKCITYYGAIKKFKNKQFVELCLDVINGILKVWSYISPISMFKQILKGVSTIELTEAISTFLYEIYGKELAVIYMNKNQKGEL